MYTVTLIPGDGIGPEVTKSMVKVVEATGVNIKWEEVKAGQEVIEEYNTPIPTYVIDSIKKNKVAIKGPITTPIGKGFKSVNVTLRQNLDLYVNLRPIKSFKGIKSRYENIDLVIVRENTEDLYAGIEHKIGDYGAESIKLITKPACERICEFAFKYAMDNNRKKVTGVHKANIMKLSDGLFLNTYREVASKYNIEYDDLIVDAAAMNLVLNPQNYDVMVMPNLYGDILSDLCAGLVGGLGIIPGANIGKEYAVFEAVHGSAPQIANQNIANPTAIIQSSVMMLRYLGEYDAAKKIENALEQVFLKGKNLTIDLGGRALTKEFTEEIIKYIKLNKRISMADVSTVEEGINCAKLGANILSTTLSGYTTHSAPATEEPDFELLRALVSETDVPVVLEGRIWEPWQVDKAFKLGAHCVVIGSAITRPQLITKRFVQRNK